jgi:hypothetical protein
VGHRWLRSDGTYELVRIENDHYVFSAGPAHEIYLTRDLAIARVLRAQQVVSFEPPATPIWPLRVGKWRTSEGIWRTPDFPSGIQARFAWSVDAVEEVRVPAGTFTAYRLSVTAGPSAGRLEQRWPPLTGKLWYAPAVHQFIKAEGRFEIGLESFQVVSVEPPAGVAAAPARQAAPAPAPPALERPTAPLAIDLRYPEDRATVTDGTAILAAVVSSGRGVVRVSVVLNGAEIHQQRESTPAPSVVVTVPVPLREGSNTLAVHATDAGGATQQVVRAVTYTRPTVAVAGVPPPAATPKNRWAVVIGIGRYDRAEIPALRYAAADAEKFAEVLVDQGGFRKDRVLLLTDRSERKPTLRNVKWALGTFLARSAGKDDLVVIFFAGHGAPEIDPRGTEPDGLAKYLVPIDADPDDLYATALPMDELQTIFARIEAEQMVMFLDACYSGAAGGRTFASKRTRASRIDDVFLERLTRSKGRVILAASRASEVSLELPELGHGLFTHYLIQGIRGTADLDRDGIVSLQELYQYAEQEVSRRSRSVGGNQHPVMKGEVEGVLPLVKLGRR